MEFLGKVSESDKYEILARSHFLIHPSYKEGFGLTVLEAGLVGTPTIARAGSSMDELIKNSVSGLIFQSDGQITDLFIIYKAGFYDRNLKFYDCKCLECLPLTHAKHL